MRHSGQCELIINVSCQSTANELLPDCRHVFWFLTSLNTSISALGIPTGIAGKWISSRCDAAFLLEQLY